jgi:hypothetical protein
MILCAHLRYDNNSDFFDLKSSSHRIFQTYSYGTAVPLYLVLYRRLFLLKD